MVTALGKKSKMCIRTPIKAHRKKYGGVNPNQWRAAPYFVTSISI